MQGRLILPALCVAAITLGFTGCNTQPSNPDQVRAKTAQATAEIKQDAQAMAQGVRDGLTRPSPDKPLNLNHATKGQLMSLPGMDDASADRVIAGRPYSNEHELLERKIISREEYNKIADSVTVTK
jgi:competence protein ComEA